MAFKLNNWFIGLICLGSFFFSIPIFISGIWLTIREQKTQCGLVFLDIPVIASGTLLMILSIAGLVGAHFKKNWLVWVYVFGVFIVAVFLGCYTIFGFGVTIQGSGDVVAGRVYKEYRLETYADQLKKMINSEKNWKDIKTCLKTREVCQSLSEEKDLTTVDHFFQKHLSSIQAGCCKPPAECVFSYKFPTVWDKTPGFDSKNGDCKKWSNLPGDLCFDCESCKAGILQNVKRDWSKVVYIDIVFLIAVALLCAFAWVFLCFFFDD